MADPLDRLKASLAGRYAIERELGAGGMATVYLARDLKHERQVAVKVLKPELAQALGVKRFLREIKTTANLRHPHILPLYDSGETDGFLYYVMPFAEGESLRDRLDREKQLPLDDALQVARQVADALDYAHSRDVVHRDIKPENILIEAGHAVVADFGIARAISAAGGETLTQTGLAVGTPAYMSPEQAAGGTDLDGRSDLYSLACVLYEMLGGQPPFTGPTAESLVRQHLAAEPSPVTNLRPGVPNAVAEAIARALAKTPADRFRRATQFADGLTQTVSSVEAAARHGHPVRVAGLFALASVAVLGVVYFSMIQFGLPGWVVPGALVLLAVGLPIILLTAQAERRRALARAQGKGRREAGMRALLTWRRATIGGVLAFAGLGVVTVGYRAMRVLGIGSLGTLLATGVLEKHGELILAEFENGTSDSTMGITVTEAFRIDLTQSPVVSLLGIRDVTEGLSRMQRDPGTALDAATALELAEREGVRAVVAGEIRTLGSGYVFAVRLVSSAEQEPLVALRESAANDGEIIAAVDRLSAKLRERIGESLKTIRATEPLEQVTTGSLEALRKYSEGLHAEAAGDVERPAALFREAIALDSTFAMAHRKLAVQLFNNGDRAGASAAATAAFRFRDRLPSYERHQAVAVYHMTVDWNYDAVLGAYRSALVTNPGDESAVNNLSLLLQWTRQFEEAEAIAFQGTQVSDASVLWQTLIAAQAAQGKFAEAHATLDRLREKVPGHPLLLFIEQFLASAARDWDTMDAAAESLSAREPGFFFVSYSLLGQAAAAEIQGKLAGAREYLRHYRATVEEYGLPGRSLIGALKLGLLDLRYGESSETAEQTVDSALDRLWSAIPAGDRPYSELIYFFSEAGRVERANRLLEDYRATVPIGVRRGHLFRSAALGSLARAQRRLDDAMAAFRDWYDGGDDECPHCAWYELGATYDPMGEVDSALATYERAVSASWYFGILKEHRFLTPTHRRLGELYEASGEHDKAIAHYNAFVELWRNADAELQPQVEEVRQRLARLVGS